MEIEISFRLELNAFDHSIPNNYLLHRMNDLLESYIYTQT